MFGSWHIMEALASEIERLIHLAYAVDTSNLEEAIPTYPYKLARIVFAHFATVCPIPGIFARVCVLALQSSDPAATFLDIAGEFGARLGSESIDDILERLVKITTEGLSVRGKEVISTMLKPEFDAFASRAVIGPAITALAENCYRYVELRVKEPFFEVALFESCRDRDSLLALLKAHPPCPIVHESGLDTETLDYFNLSGTKLDPDAVASLGAYQGFVQFMMTHLVSTGFRSTANCPPRRCLFFGSCAAPQTKSAPEICQTTPWKSFRPEESRGCWYAAGVFTSRGRADL
jgi:hypothetical protein